MLLIQQVLSDPVNATFNTGVGVCVMLIAGGKVVDFLKDMGVLKKSEPTTNGYATKEDIKLLRHDIETQNRMLGDIRDGILELVVLQGGSRRRN